MQVEISVHLTRHPLSSGGYLAQLTLNAPRRLNALSPEMAAMFYHLLSQIRDDDDAVAVLIDAAGERAFCAGDDALRLRESALANPCGAAVEAEAFFAKAYAAAHMIHTFPKPVVVWACGVVMGAGLGLMVGASHRVVTETSRLSLPEIGIGLVPGMGASWFLRQMPGATGLFCGLTGVELQAADALYAGLADYCLADSSRGAVLAMLLDLPWSDDDQWNRDVLTEALTDLEAGQGVTLGNSPLKDAREWIDRVCSQRDPVLVEQQICGYQGRQGWVCEAAVGLRRGASSTAKLIFRQLDMAASLRLEEVFRMELVLCANRIRDPEFAEGVRARLLDRDADPRWCYRSIAEVPEVEIDALFISPWPHHPLDAL